MSTTTSDLSPTPVPQTVARTRTLTLLGFSIDVRALQAVPAVFVITRVMIFGVVLVSSAAIPMRPGSYVYADPSNMIVDGLVRDDAWWYTNIATQGYSMGSVEKGIQGNAAFFPLYPMTIKVMAALTGNVYLAGILVSNIAFLFALGFLYRLARHEFDSETASRTIFYFAAAPTAIFFSAMYTESLFLATAIACFYFARTRQWDKAALAGALAAATRNTGVVLALVVLLEALKASGVEFRPPSWKRTEIWAHYKGQIRPAVLGWRGLLAAAFVPIGLIAYMAYLANTFGDPLGFIHVQATWGRSTSASGITKLISNTITSLNIGKSFFAGQFNVGTLLNVLATLGFLPLVVMVAKKMPLSFAAYTVLTFLIPLSTGTVGSMTRYILMLFPCFILLGSWGKRTNVERVVLGIFLPLMCYFTIIYSHWYFAG